MEKKVVVNREFLYNNEACGWYREFIMRTFPDGVTVTKENVKKLIAAIKKATDSSGKSYNPKTQRDILGTCLHFMLRNVKQTTDLDKIIWRETPFGRLEKHFWMLWNKKEKKKTAEEKWLEKINGPEIACIPLRVTMEKKRVTMIHLGSYSFSRKDMVQLMKLVKWDIPAKKRSRK